MTGTAPPRPALGVDAYHDLLTDDIAGESQRQLERQQRSRGLYFGDRPLCTVLRPRFLAPEQYRLLQQRGATLLAAFRRAHEAALADRSLLDQFRLEPWERALIALDPGFPDPSPISRLDAFVVEDAGVLAVTEYNAETPAGGAYNDALSEMFFALPIMREFLRQWDVRPLPARHHVLHALVGAYEQWSGRRDLPRIAIVDWTDVPTRNEFVLFQDYFIRQGLACEIVDPSEVEYVAGALRGPGGRIDVVYKRVLLSELHQRGGDDHPIFRALRDRAVCMVNPPRCKILHKKASLAVLSDERNTALFDASQRAEIAASVPWTRVVEDRRTRHGDAEVDLLPFIADHRDQLVLKPNDEYGGRGIVLGWEVAQDEWERAVAAALTEPHVVQQRIALPREEFPSLVDGRVELIARMVDTAPYVAHGDLIDGCLTRLGTAALLNVTAGGGSQTPTFIAERR